MGRFKFEDLKHADVNGYGVEMQKVTDNKTGEIYHEVLTYNDYGEESEVIECCDLGEAERVFERQVNSLRGTPNWEAQSAYDAAHGTINGQDARIVEMMELWGE